MRKSLGKLLALFVVATICVSLSSCSKDDDNSVKNQLVGVWKTTISSSNWKIIQLDANGTLHYGMYVDENDILRYSKFNDNNNALWIYSEQDQVVSLYTSDGYYSNTYKISMSSDGKGWTGTPPVSSSGSPKPVTFTRINKTAQPSTSN